ncbi:hypothetical protein N0V93_008889 [Gnomoniopsis smithogilvyi]|uniref:Protein kinase domain-containing protein n=1 Tax=Gnomoniopsis smithogilvyi TaxID=1191159 RepID=A0A9W8YKY1_9PEZI|nr:hypothetical protein N0V93_008889 [Gnomoniopsis smithogilvyi]
MAPIPNLSTKSRNDIPEIVIPEEQTSNQPSLHRQRSASELSHWTVTDRGESLYRVAQDPDTSVGTGSDEDYAIDKGNDQSRKPHTSPTCAEVQRAIIQAKCHEKQGMDMKRGFFPKGELEKIITKKIVREILDNETLCLPPTELKFYVDKICHTPSRQNAEPSYRKVFTILLLIGKPNRIVHFIKYGLSDRDLPLASVPIDDTGNIFELRHRGTPETSLPSECFGEADITATGDFEGWQWATVAPYFAKGPTRRVRFYYLMDRDILPWTKKFAGNWAGGFSSVYRIQIHPAHHEFGESQIGDGSFALKKLRDDDSDMSEDNGSGPTSTGTTQRYTRQEFEQEVDVLRRFSGNAHPNLVSLLAAFQKGKDYYLLFHWAEGDLKNFWRTTDPGSALDKQRLLWMLDQLRGISDGLQRIHNYRESHQTLAVSRESMFGRHGDIKPENMLLFRRKDIPDDKGIIQLSDFGLARFHSEHSRSGIRPSKLHGCSPTYRPPEVDFKEGKVSRAYDIWSLACVLLEFVTWQLGGWKLLEHHVQQRKQKDLFGYLSDQFFEIVAITGSNPLGARVKLEVVECSDPIHELLDFIEKEMLVVLPNDQLNTEHRRAPCGEVHARFDSLHKKVLDPNYNITATPRNVPPPERLVAAVPVMLNSVAEQKATMRMNELRQHGGPLTQNKLPRDNGAYRRPRKTFTS